MRFVPLKTPEQLDLQALHRVRDRLVARRTSVINQLRTFLLERGITVRQGRLHIERELPAILEDADNDLSALMRALLREFREEVLCTGGRKAKPTTEARSRGIAPSPGAEPVDRRRPGEGSSGDRGCQGKIPNVAAATRKCHGVTAT